MELKTARQDARYSQQQVADHLGVSRPTYARMEQTPDDITIADAKKLAQMFGVSVNDIFFSSDCN